MNKTPPQLVNVTYVTKYVIRACFDDGKSGDIDLEADLWGEVFEPLKNIDQFKQFRLDPVLRTIVWPTGADLAPEYLYSRVQAIEKTDYPI